MEFPVCCHISHDFFRSRRKSSNILDSFTLALQDNTYDVSGNKIIIQNKWTKR